MNYCAHGGVQSFQAGNYLNRSFTYNSHLQPAEIMEGANASSDCSTATSVGSNPLLDMQFFWGAGGTQTTNNNGLLQSHVVSTQTGQTSALSVTQTFGYDKMNRITSFTDNGALILGSPLQRNFAYNGAADNGQAGNVYVSNPSAGLPLGINTVADQTAYNPATNRLNLADSSTGQTATYDSNGNLLSVGTGSGTTYSFSYDAENRQTSLTDGSGTTHYVYDGNGRRVQTIAPNATTTAFVYDAFGQMVADYGAPISPTPPCQTCYLSWDHLGTTRMVTDQNGNAVSRHDFAPFGDELISGEAGRGNLWGANDPVRQKFTGAEQDNQDVSGLQDISAAPTSNPSSPQEAGSLLAGACAYPSGVVADSRAVRLARGKSQPKKTAQQANISGFVMPQQQSTGQKINRAINQATDFASNILAIPAAAIELFYGADGTPQETIATEELEGVGSALIGKLTAGGHVPNAGGTIRSFVLDSDRIYYRVFSGESNVGRFLTSAPPKSAVFAREGLSLPPGNTAEFIQEVLVPAGTRLQRSRALPAPAWGRFRGGLEQFQLLDRIPTANFGPGRSLP